MRKITQQACDAFLHGRDFSSGNTTVLINGSTARMYLHGNEIATMHEADSPSRRLRVTLAGWPTVTTRERLNGLFESLGIRARLSQRDFAQYLDGREVTAHEWIDIM